MIADDTPQNRQLRQWVADRLRLDIIEGRLRPGEWLRQEKLARRYGVSQTPVREALKEVAAEGLVEHVPYRGMRIVQFSVEDVEDLYACRSFIEGRAARYAALRITDKEVAELHELYEAMVGSEFPAELVQYRELNRRFHELVFAASGRSYLMRSLAQLWSAFPTMLWSNIPRVAITSLPDRDQPDNAEHAEIVAAFAARDPERAERAVQAHIEAAGAALRSAIVEQE